MYRTRPSFANKQALSEVVTRQPITVHTPPFRHLSDPINGTCNILTEDGETVTVGIYKGEITRVF